MKNFLKRFFSVALCFILLFGIVSCGKTSGNGENPSTPADPSSDQEEEQKYTDYMLVSEGRSDYKIVLSENADGRIRIAAQELIEFFMESTGIRLETVYDTASVPDYYISLGRNRLLDAAGISPDYQRLGLNGYTLKTSGKNVFISGGGQYGTLFGVYEFLRRSVGYEYYAEGCYSLWKNARDVRLPDFDLDVVPDIQQLMANYGVTRNDMQTGRRLGVEAWNEIWMDVDGSMWHNTLKYVPYDEAHPDWFSRGDEGDKHYQLCLSNEEMYEQAFLPKLKQVISDNPDLYNISITQMDRNFWCRCDDCKADFEKYGTDSGNMIKFINKCARDVKAWLKEKGDEREITFVMFAYHKATEPPVKELPDGTYEPIDDDVILDDNVAVWYAPIYAKWTESLTSEANDRYYQYGKKWQAVASQVFFWAYETNFSQYLVPYNTFNSMQDNFRFYKELNTKMLFSQGQFNQQGSVCFNNLKVYLQSKLRWNVNEDVVKLTQNWFDNYFGEASNAMKELYDTLRLCMAWQEAPKADGGLEYEGGVYSPSSSREYWSKGILDQMTARINEAYAAVSYLQTEDRALYTKICDRICLESIFIRYLQLSIYSGYYSSDELYEMRKTFKTDAIRLGVSNLTEGKTLDTFYGAWKI